MGVIKEDAQDGMRRKSKKRKERQSNTVRSKNNNVSIGNESCKKKKAQTLGEFNVCEVVADVDSNLGAHSNSKEKKAIRNNIIDSKMEKKKKNKIGDEGVDSQADSALENVKLMENRRRKKKKKAKDDPKAVYLKNKLLNDTNEHPITCEDGRTGGCRRKKKKSVRSSSRGTSAGTSVTNGGNGVVDHTGFVDNPIESRIIGKTEFVEGKKSKKDLEAASLVKELVTCTDVPSASNGKSSRNRGNNRAEEFIGSDTIGDANAGAMRTNKRSNPIVPSEQSTSRKKLKKVRFSDQVEFLSLADNSKGTERLKDHSNGKKKVVPRQGKRFCKDKDHSNGKNCKRFSKDEVKHKENHLTKKNGDGLVQGKWFSKEEDEMVKKSVLNYIERHHLGEKGLEMVLKCGLHPEIRDCWREIGEALPSRPHMSVYYRAHVLFERSDSREWTQDEFELVKDFYKKHGPDWKSLAEELGKHRIHVKDAWRRNKHPNMKKGKWSQDEYQTLFDLVNMDLRVKAFEEKKSKHGMLRDNISWEAISEQLSTRNNALCCQKWYDQLTSPMVAEGKWADADDYRLLIALDELDAACEEDVDWGSLMEHRSGDVCRKRWNQIVRNIGEHGNKSFAEQVEILSKRYCPELLETKEAYDTKPVAD